MPKNVISTKRFILTTFIRYYMFNNWSCRYSTTKRKWDTWRIMRGQHSVATVLHVIFHLPCGCVQIDIHLCVCVFVITCLICLCVHMGRGGVPLSDPVVINLTCCQGNGHWWTGLCFLTHSHTHTYKCWQLQTAPSVHTHTHAHARAQTQFGYSFTAADDHSLNNPPASCWSLCVCCFPVSCHSLCWSVRALFFSTLSKWSKLPSGLHLFTLPRGSYNSPKHLYVTFPESQWGYQHNPPSPSNCFVRPACSLPLHFKAITPCWFSCHWGHVFERDL